MKPITSTPNRSIPPSPCENKSNQPNAQVNISINTSNPSPTTSTNNLHQKTHLHTPFGIQKTTRIKHRNRPNLPPPQFLPILRNQPPRPPQIRRPQNSRKNFTPTKRPRPNSRENMPRPPRRLTTRHAVFFQRFRNDVHGVLVYGVYGCYVF